MEADLVSSINELDPLVGNGEDDGGHFPHLFRRPLGEQTEPTSEDGPVLWRSLHFTALHCTALPDRLRKAPTYPHFGTSVLRGLGTSQVLDEHRAQILWKCEETWVLFSVFFKLFEVAKWENERWEPTLASYAHDSKMSFSGWWCQFWTGAYGAAKLGGRRVRRGSRCRSS